VSGQIDFYSLTRTIRSTFSDGQDWPARPVEAGQLTREALNHLVRRHEWDHLVTLLSSPLGLLLWRIELTHVVDASWFAARLQEAGVIAAPGGLARWFTDTPNRKRFIEAAAGGRLSPRSPPASPSDAIETADSYIEGLTAARELYELIFGRSIRADACIADLQRAANIGHRYVAVRSDLPPVLWFSRRDPSAPLYGPAGVNARHILEAMAREYERDVLVYEGIPPQVIALWESSMYTGTYRPVIKLLRDAGLQGIPARNLCAAAIDGRLDPATVAPPKPLFVEDEMPWIRLERLLRAFKSSSLIPDDLRFRAAIEQLCAAAGLPSPREAIQAAAAQPLLGARANWDPLNRSGLAADGKSALTPHLLVEDAVMDLPRWFKRSCIAQANAWATLQMVSPDLPYAPVLYDDEATLMPQSADDDRALARELARWCARLTAEHRMAFVTGRPATSRSEIARKVRAGMIRAGLAADTATDHARHYFGSPRQAGVPGLLDDFVPPIIRESLTFIRDDQAGA
jgi:hypothetical protein